MCVEVGHICVDGARDWLQTKTKYYNMIFGSVLLSFRIKNGFCVLLDNS